MTEKDGGILDDYVGAEMRSSGIGVLVVPNALDVHIPLSFEQSPE